MFTTKKVFLLLVLVLTLLAFNNLQEDLPEIPENCKVYQYIDIPPREIKEGSFGGYIIDYPFKMCGISINTNGVWHTILYNENISTVFDDQTSVNFYYHVGDNGEKVNGYSAYSPYLVGFIIYIPIEDQTQTLNLNNKIFVPITLNKTCLNGCVFDPTPPPLP